MPRTNQDRPYRTLGDRIAVLRHRLDISQRELAKRIGASGGYLSNVELGKRRPEPDYLRRIAAALGADYTELATLARFLPPPPGQSVTVEVATTEAPIRRRLLTLPYRAAQALVELYDLWARTHDPAIGRLLGLDGEVAADDTRAAGRTP